MGLKEIQECERTKIEKWSSFQLSNAWKIRGVLISLALFAVVIGLKFTDIEPDWLKDVLRRGILVGLLIITLSKEKIEDEMISSLRAKSLILAFIFGVCYTLIQPALQYVIHSFVFKPSPDNTFSYFEILFYMLFIQIMFFEILKRNR